MTEDEMVGWHHQLNGQGWSSHGKAQDFYLIVAKRPSLFLSMNLNT